jgi:2-polyprenyl-3-methyl-5-hydroxy-6-metoxy-1,4-benzoquinol methylase
MNKEDIQESEYEFPYHYLPQFTDGTFSETRSLGWGYVYASYLEAVLAVIQAHAADIRSVVDIGCGDGRLTAEISKRFSAIRVVGTDYSERSLRFARAFSPHIEFMVETEEVFDCFTLIEVIEHIPPAELPAFLQSVREKLHKNGIGIITTPSMNTPVEKKHYQHFTNESLTHYLSPYFVIERIEYLNRQAPAWLRRLFLNKFFILNYPPLLNWLYRWYRKHYLYSSARAGTRLMAIVRAR